MSQKLLTSEEQHKLFSNVKQLFEFHQLLIIKIADKVKHWNPFGEIADVFVELVKKISNLLI